MDKNSWDLINLSFEARKTYKIRHTKNCYVIGSSHEAYHREFCNREYKSKILFDTSLSLLRLVKHVELLLSFDFNFSPTFDFVLLRFFSYISSETWTIAYLPLKNLYQHMYASYSKEFADISLHLIFFSIWKSCP